MHPWRCDLQRWSSSSAREERWPGDSLSLKSVPHKRGNTSPIFQNLSTYNDALHKQLRCVSVCIYIYICIDTYTYMYTHIKISDSNLIMFYSPLLLTVTKILLRRDKYLKKSKTRNISLQLWAGLIITAVPVHGKQMWQHAQNINACQEDNCIESQYLQTKRRICVLKSSFFPAITFGLIKMLSILTILPSFHPQTTRTLQLHLFTWIIYASLF